jgi:gentisate 1,2-dioxygenase
MNGVVIRKLELSHEDERRKIFNVFNGDFLARQMKIIDVKAGNTLGKHYHSYSEIRYLMKGRAEYVLQNILTLQKEKVMLEEGEVMITGPFVSHTAYFTEDSLIVEGTEDPYISAELNDYKHEIE